MADDNTSTGPANGNGGGDDGDVVDATPGLGGVGAGDPGGLDPQAPIVNDDDPSSSSDSGSQQQSGGGQSQSQ